MAVVTEDAPEATILVVPSNGPSGLSTRISAIPPPRFSFWIDVSHYRRFFNACQINILVRRLRPVKYILKGVLTLPIGFPSNMNDVNFIWPKERVP